MWSNENLELMKLQRAEQELLTTRKLTPLLKEELKYFVQNRSMSEGMHKLVVDFETVPEKSQVCADLEKRNKELLLEVGNLQAERDALYEKLMTVLQLAGARFRQIDLKLKINIYKV